MLESHRVDDASAGVRLDKFLASLQSVGSRKRAREAIASGKVEVDGRRVGARDGSLELSPGTRVEIAWNRPGTSRTTTRGRREVEQHGIGIVHEDADVVVIDKPPGLLTDAATHQQRKLPTVRSILGAWLRPQGDDAFIVHRIDRDTSGLVVVARHEGAADHLSRAFRAHRPLRVYWLLVHGVPEHAEGEWADPMRWDPERNLQVSAPPGTPGTVVARARYRVVERFGERASALEVRLQTGRRNQIRLHCQLAGIPLLGERQYVQPRTSGHRSVVDAPRQALHAKRLGFLHPRDGHPRSFECPIPPDLQGVLARLRRA